MNTIDDLRSTLAADASAVDAAPAAARASGVESKIRTIRRRRQAGVAGAAAAVAAIAVVSVLPALTDDPRTPPDGRLEVAGHVVPQEIEILDFDYRYLTSTESEPGDDDLRLDLEAGDRNRAVSVAVDDLPEGAIATLREDGDLLARVVGPSRLDRPVPIGNDGGTLTLTVAGGDGATRIGLAAYQRTDDLAAGLEDPTGAVVFRSQVADRQLLDGVFLEPGEGEAGFTVQGRIPDFSITTHCDSNGARVFFNVSIDGDRVMGGRCTDEPATREDPAAGSWSTLDRPGSGTHEIRIWTTDRLFSDEVVAFPDVLVGTGVYRATGGRTVQGAHVAEVIEWDGRLWRLAQVTVRSHRLEVDGPRVVGFVTGAEDTWLEVRPEDGRARRGTGLQGGAGGSALTELLWPGQAYDLSLVGQDGGAVGGAILVYRPAD